jgi:hypothetical protein
MPKGKPIDQFLKAEIVGKIRDEGLSVSEASAQYSISSKSIYLAAGWRRRRQPQPHSGEQPAQKGEWAAIQAAWPGNCRNAEVKKLAILEEVEPGRRKQFACVLKLCRTHYYRTPTRQRARDALDIALLCTAHAEHPFYGVERLAIHLGWNQKKARRIRTLAGVTIARPGKKRHNSQQR